MVMSLTTAPLSLLFLTFQRFMSKFMHSPECRLISCLSWIQWVSKHNRKRPLTTFRDVAVSDVTSQPLVNFKWLTSLCTAYVWQRLLLHKQQQEPTHQATWPSLHLTHRWINWTYALLTIFRFHFPVNSLSSLGTYPAKKTSVNQAVWVQTRIQNHRTT